MALTLVLATFTGLALHAQVGYGVQVGYGYGRGTMLDFHIRKFISREECDTPGLLSLKFQWSKLDNITIRDFNVEYKTKGVSSSLPPEFTRQEAEGIGKRAHEDQCDYKESHCHSGDCLTANCKTEHDKMFQIFKTCAKILKAYDYSGVLGLGDHWLQQFLRRSRVIARTYYWRTGYDQGGSGNTYSNMFIRLIPQKYYEAVKDTNFPVSIGKDHGNINNKRATAKCILIALGEDVIKGLEEYARDEYSSISNDLVEKVYVTLLFGTIGAEPIDDYQRKKLSATKTRYGKLIRWKLLGRKVKNIQDYALCMDPLRAEINQMQVTCQLKNIAFESLDLGALGARLQNILQPSGNLPGRPMQIPPIRYPTRPLPYPSVLPGGPGGYTHGPFTPPNTFSATTTTAPATTTMYSKSAATAANKNNGPGKTVYAGMSVGSSGPAPSQQFTNMGAPTRGFSSGGAPTYIMQPQAAPSYRMK